MSGIDVQFRVKIAIAVHDLAVLHLRAATSVSRPEAEIIPRAVGEAIAAVQVIKSIDPAISDAAALEALLSWAGVWSPNNTRFPSLDDFPALIARAGKTAADCLRYALSASSAPSADRHSL